jgi:hypothetical protein
MGQDWTNAGFLFKGTAPKELATLRRRSSISGEWSGMVGGTPIFIREATFDSGEPCLVLYEGTSDKMSGNTRNRSSV